MNIFRKLMWGHTAVCTVATIVGTSAFIEGQTAFWALNCVIFLVNAAMAYVNYTKINSA